MASARGIRRAMGQHRNKVIKESIVSIEEALKRLQRLKDPPDKVRRLVWWVETGVHGYHHD